MKVSGYICVRNAVSLDYCLKEAAESLIPVVDELIICDGESTDETMDIIFDLMRRDSRVVHLKYPWPKPHRDLEFWVTWLNFARRHCTHPMQITLDADEVLHESAYPTIRAISAKGGAGLFQRFNFWNDANHLAPHNTCCGTMVARLGPTELYMPSDEPRPKESPNVREIAREYPNVHIFHYGFIRNPAAFVRKSTEVQNMFFGSVDRRITDMGASGKDWRDRDYFEGQNLPVFDGSHPAVAHNWLRERGYKIP